MGISSTRKTIQLLIVILSCILSVLIRLFSNVINEPIIHEFDPHFNWRCSQYIDQHGFYEFLGWYDNISWYPQGRPVGETSYPGLMYTSVLFKRVLDYFHIKIPLLYICVHMGPIFATLTCLLSFLFGQLIYDSSLGCVFSFLASFITGFISRSVAGSYDYECIALFIMLLALFSFVYALKNASILLSIFSAFSFAYMALTWGGYVFVANAIPLFTVGLIAIGRYSWRLHVTYSIWSIVSLILIVQIPFIHEKILSKPEHFAMIATLFGIQVWGFFTFIHDKFTSKTFTTITVLLLCMLPLSFFVITILLSTGLVGDFSGRLLLMFDPSYATKNIPIIASVAEHQPSSWSSYFMECAFFMSLFPAGCYFVIKDQITIKNFQKTEASMLLLIYGLSTLYFGSIMVRLVLVFSPACVYIGGIAMHSIIKIAMRKRQMIGYLAVTSLGMISLFSLYHSVWLACFSYSSDHIHFWVTTPRGQESSDDYREGYRWLWENTHRDDKVMSWWDYGYQITSMGGRGCMADGNTNNFTHIGIIGMTMGSPEPVSWRLARMMNMKYLLVIFGGASGYDGDDINKFMWMPKIANQTFHNISGSMFQKKEGYPIVGQIQTDNMTHSMMFKMCYYNFKDYQIQPGLRNYDIARKTAIVEGLDFKFKLFEEAFSSKNWIVRIYKVLPDPQWNRVY
ncbi:Oligosaccharyl transferase STT3 subunit family protein [Trichomonas vaginalis G3]|uniref:dolichyl-diphosphooligosaccharide--protein glycotransferase n=1 Tax=Trichomonas vaginalis (strain ATCC PRA-98 / G3) TaxID=412133 RepID=A2EDZ3_TRIV3|nr:dolichyl-diphosphooligosaccharide--protein glycosyltransferase subunit family [Trichomonas vaginalis G3]EAY09105.1 Oligosaccharyl transferase STT3 subunit family protein [Trichomonas vaginalis G3]KAI5502663.1 dolichyl-diphosphooligosaccharide--protein glycosyltransferase subunit family [Trichomonas vaginalis G3]|eukprot:XP_001321328.1 Oligosaccharyl transferase STT3 subunit family protein [Trichomonas vaginalis G3]